MPDARTNLSTETRVLTPVNPGLDHRRSGYFIKGYPKNDNTNKILTIRCWNCFQHLSLYENSIVNGVLQGEIVCLGCRYITSNVRMSSDFNKDKDSVFLQSDTINGSRN